MLTRAHLEHARLDRLTSAAAAVEAADVERSVSRRRIRRETRAEKKNAAAGARSSSSWSRRTFRLPHAERSIVRTRHHPSTRPRFEPRRPHGGFVSALFRADGDGAAPVVAAGILGPHLDGVVVRHGDQDVLRGMPNHLLDILRVSVQNRDALEIVSGLEFPDPHGFIAAARGQQLAAGGPRAGFHLVLVALHHGDALPLAALLRPHGGAGVETRGGEESAWGTRERGAGEGDR